MHASFSFCGINIEDIGLSYAPELTDTYVSKPAEAQSHYESFEAHNGGYFYGSWFAPKEFTLRCFFEETSIENGIVGKIYALFKVGKSGKLIFSRQPWCYYDATVTEPVELNLTNYLNGTVTVHMKAMYPFARSDIKTNTRAEKYHDMLMNSTAVFEKAEMDYISNVYTDITSPPETPVVLANQGTERAALGVAIAGNVGKGVIIKNLTTGQSCKFVAVSKAKTSDVNREVVIDPISGKIYTGRVNTHIDRETGKTIFDGYTEKELAFLYHEYGFLELESSFPAIRNIYVSSLGDNHVKISNIITENVENKYIYTAGKWRKIKEQLDEHTLRVDSTVPSGRVERTMIIPMNEITVEPITTMDITSLRFIYKPTYS